jgi:hypothetical protein
MWSGIYGWFVRVAGTPATEFRPKFAESNLTDRSPVRHFEVPLDCMVTGADVYSVALAGQSDKLIHERFSRMSVEVVCVQISTSKQELRGFPVAAHRSPVQRCVVAIVPCHDIGAVERK